MRKIIIILLIPFILSAQKRFDIPCYEYLFYQSLDSLRTQIGITESGNNGGAVLKYQYPYKNIAYCKALQDWTFKVNAISKNELPYPLNPLAISIYQFAEKHGIQVVYEASVGTFIIWKQSGKIYGHIGRIDTIYDNRGNVGTIEGNTSPDKKGSQREGSGVYPKHRNIKHPLSRLLQIKGLVGFKLIRNNKQGCNYK